MSRIIDATIYIADDDSAATSDSNYHTLLIDGSTVRILTQRNPAYNDGGYLGEYCFGSVDGTTYLYYYNGTQWLRSAFSTYS